MQSELDWGSGHNRSRVKMVNADLVYCNATDMWVGGRDPIAALFWDD